MTAPETRHQPGPMPRAPRACHGQKTTARGIKTDYKTIGCAICHGRHGKTPLLHARAHTRARTKAPKNSPVAAQYCQFACGTRGIKDKVLIKNIKNCHGREEFARGMPVAPVANHRHHPAGRFAGAGHE